MPVTLVDHPDDMHQDAAVHPWTRRLKYATLSGVPLRDYVGEVDLTPTPDGGTSVHWHSSFFPKVPGTGRLAERGIHKFLSGVVEGLVAYAPTVRGANNVEPA